jgi:hypothetical protein
MIYREMRPLLKMYHIVRTLTAFWSRDAPRGLTFNNCTLCPLCIYVFCIYLKTNRYSCHLHHKLIGFYNRDENFYSAVRTGSLKTQFKIVELLCSTQIYSCIHISFTVTNIPATKEELHLKTLNWRENIISRHRFSHP